MKVKICGITNKDDAVWAINYGADHIGLNFWKDSKRHVSVQGAAEWVPQLPAFASIVGVFVDAGQNEILPVVQKLNLKGIQLHGDETPSMLTALRLALQGMGRTAFLIKAFRMQDETTIERMAEFKDAADYFLLDSFLPDQRGGTGARFNWDLAVKAKAVGKPIILAGGLTPDNVKDAVRRVQPAMVDVASGVEKSPKKKDLELMKEFIRNAKA